MKPLEVIRAVLKGDKSFDTAVNDFQSLGEPAKPADPDSIVGWLYRNAEPGSRICVKVGRNSAKNQIQPGLRLFVNLETGGDGTWYVRPFLLRPKRLASAQWYDVAIEEHWIEGLVQCVQQVFDDCYPVPSVDEPDHNTLTQFRNFDHLIWAFRREGERSFFQDQDTLKKWVTLSHWDDWQRKKLTQSQQEEALSKLGYGMSTRSYSRTRKNAKVSKLRTSGDTRK